MKTAKKFLALILSGIIPLIFSCGGGGGGGGGGGSTDISYTGLTTMAKIDSTNAIDLATGALRGGTTGAALGFVGAVQTKEHNRVSRPRIIALSRTLEKSLRSVDISSGSRDIASGAIQPETINGDCGGSALYTINLNDETGDFNSTMRFNNYCSESMTVSGNANFSGKVDLNTKDILEFSFSFANLTVASGNDSFVIKGDTHFDFSASPATIFNALLLDNNTKKVYRIEDYNMIFTEGAGYVDVAISGTYYDPDYGYVFISTPYSEPDPKGLRIYTGSQWPSQGVLFYSGAVGIGGGCCTHAQLTALSSTTYRVEADTHGVTDTTYDWNSGVLNWSDI